MITRTKAFLRSTVSNTDVSLLFLICALMIDSVVMKPFALLISLLWIKGVNWKLCAKQTPPFYFLITGICIIQYFVLADFSKEYLLFFCIGISYWLMSIFAFIVIYSRIQSQQIERTESTLQSFFLINVAVTFAQLFYTMYLSGSVNPYAIWDNPEYGNSTGDHLKGIFLAPSYINFMANSFFAIYFLYRRQLLLSFGAVVTLCLTSSNFAIIFFLPVYFILSFITKVPKAKVTALASFGFIFIFYFIISIGNFYYLAESILKVEHHYDHTKIGEVDNTVSTNKKAPQKEDINYFSKQKGKLISVCQTTSFVTTNSQNFLLGAGMGNFSSMLAKRQSDIQQEQKSRLFRMLPNRVATAYKENHYKIERHLYNLPSDWHSIQHLPASTFNQLLGEYGILGSISFLFFYAFFMLKKTRFKLPFLAIAILMGYYLMFDYLFEYLSIIVLFEIFYIVERNKFQKTEEYK